MKNRLNFPSTIAWNKEPGQVALVTVMILLSIGVVVTITGVLTTIDSAKNARIEQQSADAFFLADGCTEEGHYRYKRSSSYTGENLNIGNGSCIITVTGSTDPKTITVEATVGEHTRKIESTINRSPYEVVTWEEIP